MDKRQELIAILLREPGAVSGEDLAAQLGVSSRTVRSYVRAHNRRDPVIVATHRGYTLNRELYLSSRSSGRSPDPG